MVHPISWCPSDLSYSTKLAYFDPFQKKTNHPVFSSDIPGVSREKKRGSKMGGSPRLRPPKTAPGKISEDPKKKIMFKPPPKQSPISTTQKAYGEAILPPKKNLEPTQKHMWWSKERLHLYLYTYISIYIYLKINISHPSIPGWFFGDFDKTTYKTLTFWVKTL